MSDVVLVALGPGALALTHRPKLRDLPALRAAGATHLVTLLAEKEGAQQLGAAAQRAGLAWIWVPLVGAAVPEATRDHELRRVLRELCELLTAGSRVVVHCSAGIHRTGMFGYALLRQFGLDPDVARQRLTDLRQLTADGVGDARLAWGDRLTDGAHA
jgi:protein-tyrosine phosphatase